MLSFFRLLAGAAYLESNVLTPHSSYNRRWQLQHGGDPDRMWTMYNGVSLAEFPVADSEPEIPTLVFMGRIDPLKDLHSLIRAFALVRAEIPDAVLRIFGGTPPGNESYYDSCVRLVEDLGLGGVRDVRGPGRLADEPPTTPASVVVLTSISEGFPVHGGRGHGLRADRSCAPTSAGCRRRWGTPASSCRPAT